MFADRFVSSNCSLARSVTATMSHLLAKPSEQTTPNMASTQLMPPPGIPRPAPPLPVALPPTAPSTAPRGAADRVTRRDLQGRGEGWRASAAGFGPGTHRGEGVH